jgi:hypothetical protein
MEMGKKKKNQWHQPIHQKYKANVGMSKHKPKKTNNEQKIRNKPSTNKNHGYKMMIYHNKEDLGWESYHLPQIG